MTHTVALKEPMKMGSKSERFWDRFAKYYDRIEKNDEPVNTAIIERTKRLLTISDTVLDYGCGTGTAALALAGSVGRIHGIDNPRNMIEMAKGKTADRRMTNIDFAHATIYDETLQARSFDAVLCFYLLHLVEDTSQVI